ncbi:MAG: 50S ribosomal protein L21e [Candidatus Woesearchaeota archaeon]
MAKRTGTSRRKTRNKFRKPISTRGRIPIRGFLQSFKSGEKVVLLADPCYQKGMYFRRFHGKIGVVHKARGKIYEVLLKDSGKEKTLLVNPVHLRRV